jgi:Tol biopolymer transport system component
MKIIQLLVLSVIFGSCAVRNNLFEVERSVQYIKKERVIDYRDFTVPEESGTQFIQFSTERDFINNPYVENKKGIIYWEADSKIDISPDGNNVAYVGFSNGKSNIYIKSTKGGKSTIQRTFKERINNVSYSIDGKYLAYAEKLDSDMNVNQIDANQGAAVQQITNTSQIETSPIYSPDNKSIYYTKGEYSTQTDSYRYYIWSFERGTSILSQFCEGFSPTISSDSKILYFGRNNKQTGLGEIWSVNLLSGQETQILADIEKGFSTPKISPDGKTLLVTGSTLATSKRVENLDVYTIKTDGTKLTQLTFHPGHDLSPAWSPEGNQIYFISQRGNEKGNYGIWSINYNKQ